MAELTDDNALPVAVRIGYSDGMLGSRIEIVRCPPHQIAEAAALVLGDLAPASRRETAPELFARQTSSAAANEALYVALRDGEVYAATWGQRQPGNTAVLWPPRFTAHEQPEIAAALVNAAARDLDAVQVGMIQVLLREDDTTMVAAIQSAGFHHLADLIYLTCEATTFPASPPEIGPLEFEPYAPSQRGRMMAIVERTYEGTQDCAALEMARSMDDVIDGYQATGEFRPSNWLFVRAESQDVGVLLLAEHPSAGHVELTYMGLVPKFRGRGWGAYVAYYAQWLARCAKAERIVLAVDAANGPALAMYGSTGFIAWDRRKVFVRFPADLAM